LYNYCVEYVKEPSVTLAVVLLLTAAVGPAGIAAGTPFETTDQQSLDATIDAPGIAELSNETNTTNGSIETTTTASSTETNDTTCSFPISLTDATGTTVTIEERPDRLTTTNPSAAQTLWEIGAQDRVVGLTQYASYLEGTDGKTNVSAAGFGISVERVVNTTPDLVLVPNATGAQTVATLRDANLTVYHVPAATDVDDIAAKTERIGRLVGSCDAAASVNEEMNDTVASVSNRTSEIEPPTALYPLGGGFVAGNNTFINEIMQISGTTNVAAAEGEGYPQLSDEVILQADPELLIVTSASSSIPETEPYSLTTAGIENRTVVMNVNYLNQPAPRSVIESTQTLASAVEALDTPTDEQPDDGSETGRSDSGDRDGDDDTERTDDGSTPEEPDPRGSEIRTSVTAPAVYDAAEGRAAATFDGNTSVTEVSINTDRADGDVRITELETEPDETGPAPGTRLIVTAVDVPEAAADSPGTIEISIDSERVSSLSASPTDLRVSRYNDDRDRWEWVPTRVGSGGDGTVQIVGETPGFSYFAVTVAGESTAVLETAGTATAGTTFTLNASASTTTYGELVAYEWAITEGDAIVTETPSGMAPTVLLQQPGVLTIELTVENDAGVTDSTTKTITVEAAETGSNGTESGAERNTTADDQPNTNESDAPSVTDIEVPGFGPLVAMAALVSVALTAARWRK
jgi:iron complex transport system substrate-binding protein